MNVGFDLDKIFINTPPFVPGKIIEWFYKGKPDGLLKYRIPSRAEQIIRLFSHHPLFRPVITRNINYVKNLASTSTNKYYLISGRFGFLKNSTEALIKRHGFNEIFDAMFFNFVNKKNKKTRFFWLNNNTEKIINDNLIAITHLSKMLQ